MTDERKAAPGWYPHPSMADTQRYWDGQQWTAHIAPAATDSARASADFRHWGGVLLICGALAIAGVAMKAEGSDNEAGNVLLGLAIIIGVIALVKLGAEMVSRK